MRITAIHERAIPVSRYADPAIPSGGLTTSVVAVVTDVVRDGRPVTGYGYASIGRFAQGGLIRERFAPRLLAAADTLADEAGTNLDPFRAWRAMMAGEKPGGHGERCVAVGTLDMAIWDAAAKIADLPLHRFLADRLQRTAAPRVRVYAGGGYRYPHDDLARLSDEIRRIVDLGYTHAKIKIGGADFEQDRHRIEAAAAQLADPSHLAVDAMNMYDATTAHEAADMLAPFGLWWFEDICDPLDLPLQADIATRYAPPIAAGEALFSLAEAKLLDRYGGLRADRLELRDDLRVRAAVGAFEARFQRVDGGAERRRPAAQRMDDRAQRRQHGAGRLPAVRGDDQADRAAVEIRAFVRAQLLERVERVLHETGHAAVIAGRRDDDRVGLAHGVDQLALRVGQRFVFGGVVRQRMQERAVEQARACAGGLRAAQCERQRAFGGRCGSGGPADADDERAAVLIECSQGALLGLACPAKHRLKIRW